MVGRAAEHHAVDVREVVRAPASSVPDAAVEDHLELGEVGLEPVHQLVAQRRDLAVLLRAQAGSQALRACTMKRRAAGAGDGVDEGAQEAVVVLLVDAEAAS